MFGLEKLPGDFTKTLVLLLVGLSLADPTGMDRSALSKLETGRRPNPTVERLVPYAEAVGKRLVVRRRMGEPRQRKCGRERESL